jgi:hypothetical protein
MGRVNAKAREGKRGEVKRVKEKTQLFLGDFSPNK